MSSLYASLPRTRRQAVLRLWLVNIALGVGIGAAYLHHVPEGLGVKGWLFLPVALVSTVVRLSLLPGILFLALASIRAPHRLLGWVQSVVWALLQLLLLVDTRIYSVFKYHFNGQVWNLIVTRGSEDAVHLGWQVWLLIGSVLGVGSALQHLVWRRVWRGSVCDEQRSELRAVERPPARRLVRPAFVWGLLLIPAVVLDQSIYAHSDLARDRQVTALAKLFPLYPRLPVEDFASRVLGVDVEARPRVSVNLEGVDVRYPLALPILDADGPRPDVLVLVIDCWRQDMLDAETTPELHAFARGCRRFDDHVSGGNSTRYGLFSMLYGLHGSYWFPFVAAQRGPVLIDALLELDYDVRVFSAATMNYPELRSTAWVRIPERVHDEWGDGPAWRRDEQAAEALARWWRQGGGADRERPRFGFLLLDSPHQTYSHPPGGVRFSPSAEELDYVALSTPPRPEPQLVEEAFNRYRNAVHHTDAVLGGLLAELDSGGLLEDAVVVVTGDHGEEFLECGFFGHTSSFTPEQVAVPFLMRGPGIEPGVETRPTSHLDLPSTLLELLGASPDVRAAWSLGENLLAPDEERRRTIAGWNELGLWTPEGVIRIPLDRLDFELEVYEYDWTFVARDEDVIARERDALEALAEECNRFLR